MKKRFLWQLFCAIIIIGCSKTTADDRTDIIALPFYSFAFTGYDVREPTHWTILMEETPDCNYAQGDICYIRTIKDLYLPYPSIRHLDILAQMSSNFSSSYSGVAGSVRLKP